MNKIKNKPINCVECGYLFDKVKPYHARGCCNACYQKGYLRDKMPVKTTREKQTHCDLCKSEYGTLNHKGRPVTKGANGLCKTCYSREKKPKKECDNCGNQMIAGSKTGLCAICKELKRATEGKRSYKRKVKELPLLDIHTCEQIRLLLNRYKRGINTLVDNFRVADIYMSMNETSLLLDTLTEESQVVEMLRTLKSVYEYNKEDREKKIKDTVKKSADKERYQKRKKGEKKVNKTADIKAYRREYYKKNYANGGYIMAALRREAKN